jgi:pilus assembly protein CpaF
MNGQIISIYSSKGGVGKSFIAANLAVDLCLDTKEKVLLIDFGRPFSCDIGYFLKLKDIKRIDSLLPMADKLHPSMLKGYASAHSSGIFVLSLSDGFHNLDDNLLNPQTIGKVMACLQSVYTYIIIDIGTKFDPVVEAIFDKSGMILLPITPDALSLKQTQNDLKLLRSHNFSKERVKVIVNRLDKSNPSDIDVMARHLGKKPEAIIPFDPDANANMAMGSYPEKFPRHPLTQALDQMVYIMVQTARSMAANNQNNDPNTNAPVVDLDALKLSVHEKLLESLDFKKLDTEVGQDSEKSEALKSLVAQKISEIIDNESSLQDRQLRNQVLKEVLQEALGLGPL